jgi:hypothetical protein
MTRLWSKMMHDHLGLLQPRTVPYAAEQQAADADDYNDPNFAEREEEARAVLRDMFGPHIVTDQLAGEASQQAESEKCNAEGDRNVELLRTLTTFALQRDEHRGTHLPSA